MRLLPPPPPLSHKQQAIGRRYVLKPWRWINSADDDDNVSYKPNNIDSKFDAAVGGTKKTQSQVSHPLFRGDSLNLFDCLGSYPQSSVQVCIFITIPSVSPLVSLSLPYKDIVTYITNSQ